MRAIEVLLELDDDMIREKIAELKEEHERLSCELARNPEPHKLTAEHVKFWISEIQSMPNGVLITSFLDKVLIRDENDIEVYIKNA